MLEPPIYDENEPIYKFKRRWDLYIENKNNKAKYDNILIFINTIFKSEYKNLLSIKEIYEMPNLKQINKIAKKMNYTVNCNNPIDIINSILNTIDYSISSSNKDGKIIYHIKHIITMN
jgi:hypothetical protein